MDAVSVVAPPKADPQKITLTKEAMRAILKDKLAAMKAKVAVDALNKPDGGTVSSVELVQQAENELHWQKGEILCFMLPKLGFEPEKMISVYGTLANDVLEICRYGTCVMQDGTFSTFAYSVVWAAKERMRDEKYRSRCPYTRLKQWFTSKSVDATEFAREILASEQRYKETIEGTNSPMLQHAR